MSARIAEIVVAAVSHRFPVEILAYVVLVIAALLIAFVVSWLLFMFITSMCERQYLAGDVEPVREPYPTTPLPYWLATRADALKFGLHPAGDFATKKNTSIVKGLMSLFVSQNGIVLVAVVSTSTTGAKLRKTVMRSFMTSGRILESSDSPGLEDLSGVVERQILVNAGIAELMNFHVERVRKSGLTPLPFNPDAALAEFEKMELQKGARLVLLKLARWADPQQTSIRMTWRGALHTVKRVFAQGDEVIWQQERSRIPRAGSRPGD
jgi:hypothetical protein